MATISSLYSEGAARLTQGGVDSASLDTELILAHVLEKSRAYVVAHGSDTLSRQEEYTVYRLIEKRAQRVPIAYILGHKEFFGIDFFVNKYTLIPRPETELLVRSVIEYCHEHPSVRSIVELGIGSGCILLSILINCPQLTMGMGIEFVKRALDIAKKNAEQLGLVDRVTFKRSDMWQQLTKEYRYDIVVANLPYLSAYELAAARSDCPEIAFEPQIALLGGTDGLLFFERLFQRAHRHLRPGAAIFLEIGALQAASVTAIAQKYLSHGLISVKKDDCARDRVIMIQMP